MNRSLLSSLQNDDQLDRKTVRGLSIVFLGIAGVMSLLTYTHEGRILDTSVGFAPRFLSTAVALALVAPLYLRRILTGIAPSTQSPRSSWSRHSSRRMCSATWRNAREDIGQWCTNCNERNGERFPWDLTAADGYGPHR